MTRPIEVLPPKREGILPRVRVTYWFDSTPRPAPPPKKKRIRGAGKRKNNGGV